MRVVVQKYGGSSVATVEKLRAVAAKVVETRRQGFGVVVVVSAMGDTTDELLALARQVCPSPPARELDMLLSVGERISMSLLSSAIHDLGEQAISFTGSQCGIVTTDSHSNARIIDVRPFRVQDELERGRVVIVAGYQGTSYRREITTLGRGGSDTTAVALAAALGAEHCDIFSDVDGIYTADPRIVPDARRLSEISHEEMQELARLGARVMNATAVEFARRERIAIFARSTFGGGEGTAIRRVDGFPDEQLRVHRALGVRGVAGTRDAILCSARALGSAETAALLGVVGDDALVAASLTDDVSQLVISGENVADLDSFAARLQSVAPDQISVRVGMGTASAVGLGVGGSARALARAAGALVAAEIPVSLWACAGESITAVVDADRSPDAMRALHAAFIESP
ncbi:MAG: aspartate kinase [Myxococcales bacterium]|nr:aspartate kinase [Myxococcales bacterium]MCB9520016.1 aspartate kinase [Myxococcales bacterium]